VANAPTKRKLPGRPRPAEDVRREYQNKVGQLLSSGGYDESRWTSDDRLRRVWGMLAPDAKDVFRWRVKFDCGCIEERFTRGDEADWLQQSDVSYQLRSPKQLPPGQFLCHDNANHPNGQQLPLQDVVEWHEREEVNLAPDPVELPQLWEDIPDIWAVIRRDEERTSAFYTVKLECGHYDQVIAPDLEWKPDDGPRFTVTAERLQEMRDEIDDDFIAACPKEARRIADGFPRPAPYEQCWLCAHVRSVVAYEPVGFLDSPPPPPPKPKRKALEARLQKLESEAAQLRKQIEEAD
jgi:hypothetical protein